MSNLNRLTMIGNIGTDPEFVAFESGAMLTKFTLAVNRYDKKNQKDVTDWFNVETFSKLGEYLKKGIKVCIDGRLITNVWEDKDGKHIKNYIVQANTVEILTKKESEQTSDKVSDKAETSDFEEEINSDLIGEDEIPF